MPVTSSLAASLPEGLCRMPRGLQRTTPASTGSFQSTDNTMYFLELGYIDTSHGTGLLQAFWQQLKPTHL